MSNNELAARQGFANAFGSSNVSSEPMATVVTGLDEQALDSNGVDEVNGSLAQVWPPEIDAARQRKQKMCMALGIVIFFALFAGAIIGIIFGLRSRDNGGSSKQTRKASVSQVIAYLNSSGVSPLSELESLSSLRNLAAQWLAEVDFLNLPVPSEAPSTPAGYHYISRYVLALFWFIMYGPNWTRNADFMTGVDVCDWHEFVRVSSGEVQPVGVLCDNTTNQISNLQLDFNNLEGSLPNELGYLSTLHVLAFDGNAINGTVPTGLCQLSGLVVLSAVQNSLSGSLSSCLSGMVSLQFLALGTNYLTNTLPDLSALTKLRYLVLDNNDLQANVTSMFNSMRSLRRLYIDDNRFTGNTDDSFLANLSELERVDVSGCGLTGRFPRHLLAFSELQVLDMHNNNLFGGLPDRLDKNTALLYLALYNNPGLGGTVSAALTNISEMIHFDGSNCGFSGEFPDHFGSLTKLGYLFLSVNEFTSSPIPASFASLSRLRELSLKSTNRTGSIPSFIGNFTQLALLDLDDNGLNSTIPPEIGNNTLLQFLLINRNERIGGGIPDSTSSLSFLRVGFFDRTNLTGSFETICSLPNFNTKVTKSLLTADCLGASPAVVCVCCDVCCASDSPVCHDYQEVPNLRPEWQLSFDRVAYDFGGGPNGTFLSDTRADQSTP